ncbi:MAG: ACP S-malonyltransferase, partial [Pseudomonadota bacterium]|nr:ACP S-malonyltransferase [Pseudomonadota bacterium]MEC9458632.1 ACP S-malonyltransferase [Pseudomonadota bacterium]
AQPAIMVVGIAIIKILTKRGFEINNLFNFSAGHSLGEYTSLAALDSLSLSDTAKLLKIRGKSMQSSFPKNKGSMAAILGLKKDEVEEVLSERKNESICQIANDNAPEQVVISGEIHCVEEAIELLKEKGAKKAVKLPVSAPFHCDLMKKAKEVMNTEINNTLFDEPLVPIIQNVSVEPTKNTEVIKKNLIDQVTGTVRWRETMLKFVELNVSCIVEVGAGTVLTNLTKRNSPNLKRITLNSKKNIEDFMKEYE